MWLNGESWKVRHGKSDAVELHLPPTQVAALGRSSTLTLGRLFLLGEDTHCDLGDTIHYDLGEPVTNYDLGEVTPCDQMRSPTETLRCSHFPLSPNICCKIR